MPLVDGGIYEARVFATKGDQTAINVLHFDAATVIAGDVTLVEAANAFYDTWGPAFLPMASAAVSFRGVGLRQITIPLPVETFSTTAPANGTNTSPTMPTQVSGIVSYYTAVAGRGGRGRTYVPFPSQSANDTTDLPTTVYMELLTALVATYGTGWTVSGLSGGQMYLRLGVYHRLTKTFTPVIKTVPRVKWATQRRRGSEGRPNSSPI